MAKKANAGKGSKHQASARPAKQTARPSAPGSSSLFTRWGTIGFLAISGLIFLLARINLLAIPLERDEGSFAYIGHWLFKGRELYTDMLDSKLPGLYTIYGLSTALFGYHSTGVHMGLFLANIASAICLFLLSRQLFNTLVAALATSFYLFLAVSPNMVGFASHATQLLTPFLLGGLLLFWKGIQSGRNITFLFAGLLIGIAFTIKQQAAIYGVLLAVLWWPVRLSWMKREGSRIPIMEWVTLGVGGFIPLAMIVGYFGAVGRLNDFYNWTVIQPFSLAGSYRQPWYELFLNIIPPVVSGFESIWILAATGLVLIFISGFNKAVSWFGSLMGLLGIISVAIGAAYYAHYFVLAIPGVAILAACSLNWIAGKTGKAGAAIALLTGGILLIISMKGRTDYFFYPDYARIHYEMYSYNMFPELEKIGKELAHRVKEGDRIGILGSEPEVLVAADRESCSRFLMVYAMLIDPVLSPPMQEEWMKTMKECAPEYIIYSTYSGSWAPNYNKLKFFLEFMPWVHENYTGIGLAESRGPRPGLVLWDEEATAHQSESDYKILVLKRKDLQATPLQ